jgi:hypothetical protein
MFLWGRCEVWRRTGRVVRCPLLSRPPTVTSVTAVMGLEAGSNARDATSHRSLAPPSERNRKMRVRQSYGGVNISQEIRVNGSKRSLSPRRKPARVRMFDGGAGGVAARLSMYHYCTQTTHGEMALLMTICVLMLGSAAGFCPSALPNCAPVGMARAAPVIMKDWSKRAVSLFIFYSSTDCIYPCFGAHNLSFPTSQRPQCATCVARYLLTLCALTCVPKP